MVSARDSATNCITLVNVGFAIGMTGFVMYQVRDRNALVRLLFDFLGRARNLSKTLRTAAAATRRHEARRLCNNLVAHAKHCYTCWCGDKAAPIYITRACCVIDKHPLMRGSNDTATARHKSLMERTNDINFDHSSLNQGDNKRR